MREIKVGDSYRFAPSAFLGDGKDKSGHYEIPKELEGRVVFVHP